MKNPIIFFLVFFLGGNWCSGQTGPSILYPDGSYPVQNSINAYFNVIDNYNGAIDDYSGEDAQSATLPAKELLGLFTPDAQVVIDFPVVTHRARGGANNDTAYIREGSKVNIEDYIHDLDASINNKKILGFKLTPASEVLKCWNGKDEWRIWTTKVVTYKDADKKRPIKDTVRLVFTYKKQLSPEGFKIIDVSFVPKVEFPTDKDHDFIADFMNCDNDVRKLIQSDNAVVTMNGVEQRRLYRKYPISRFGVAVSFGYLGMFNNELLQQDINASNITLRPTYFAKDGTVGDVYIMWGCSPHFAMEGGAMFTRNSLDEEQLSTTINDYMATYGTGSVQKIHFDKVTRKLTMPYLALKWGNFHNAAWTASVGLIAGAAFPSNSSNTFGYRFEGDSIQGGGQTRSFQLKASPFFVYGVRARYELGLSAHGDGRLFLSGSILSGEYSFANEESTANSLALPSGNSIVFQNSQLFLYNISLGFFLNIKAPRYRKEQERTGIHSR